MHVIAIDPATIYTGVGIVAYWLVLIGFSIRVISRRRKVGTSLAWLAVICLAPFIGAGLYILFGEQRLGEQRGRRMVAIRELYRDWQERLHEHASAPETAVGADVQRHVRRVVGFPAMRGNQLALLDHFQTIFDALIADVDRAQRTCHIQTYIWADGGRVDDLVAAIIRAVDRGVACRLLVDAIGSGRFLKSATADRLRDAGVEIVSSMEVGLLRTLFVRLDLRNHRKIVVIDGEVAYVGSQNIVDPRHFKRGQGIGPWVDAMIRLEGPIVEALGGIFLKDWEFDTGRGREIVAAGSDVRHLPEVGEEIVQLLPSGPGWSPAAAHELLTAAIYAARDELLITTPYFVPDESIIVALRTAAHRGVRVTLTVPAKVDSKLVRFASRAYFDELMCAGVRIAQYRGGLLHTKALTIDGKYTLFGSANLDLRSLWLNFEITMLIFSERFTREIVALQHGYLADSDDLHLQVWRSRPRTVRFAENAVRLVGPLL